MYIDIDWFDDPEAFNQFLGVSIAFDFNEQERKDLYGLWVKKDYAEKNFNLGWVVDYCGYYVENREFREAQLRAIREGL